MPFEGFVCPQCRADRDFIKIEEDTYYCPWHKGLFKYVDQGRDPVQGGRDFCPCGNMIEFQCQLCRAGVCGECDIVQWHKRNEPPLVPAWQPSLAFAVQGIF